ncbi:hypothetical protein [Bacillus paralicheniformis]|uniref:hypothetical protein n=1 Tax=Bacillus paralicheniformis TaxID=1648923 RepID=UPI001FD71A79|nr:hypothetical protein [Bacillus paralicheniformis]MCJ8223732.1 hypothetical protein [Bacillus paralicheniformis]
MEVGSAYERKNFEYKVVAKVPHESKEGEFVYLVAQREFGSDEVEYFKTETEFDTEFEKTVWLGI